MRSADSVAVSIDEMQSMSSSAFSKMTSASSYSSDPTVMLAISEMSEL